MKLNKPRFLQHMANIYHKDQNSKAMDLMHGAKAL